MGGKGAMFAGGKKKFKNLEMTTRRERQERESYLAEVNRKIDAEEQRREEARDDRDQSTVG